MFKPALKDAGLPDDIRPYDLRHARASMLVASGVGIVEAAAQLGHAPTVLLDTYAHVLEGTDGKLDVDAEVAKARGGRARIALSISPEGVRRVHRSKCYGTLDAGQQ